MQPENRAAVRRVANRRRRSIGAGPGGHPEKRCGDALWFPGKKAGEQEQRDWKNGGEEVKRREEKKGEEGGKAEGTAPPTRTARLPLCGPCGPQSRSDSRVAAQA